MLILTIIDSTTSAPISGAKVYATYTLAGLLTTEIFVSGSNGTVTLPGVAGTPSVQVVAQGYQQYTADTSVLTTIPLTSTTPAGTPIYIWINTGLGNSTNGASIQFQRGSQSETLTLTGNLAGISTVKSYTPGSYTLTVTASGFNPYSDSGTLTAGQTDLVVTLSQVATGASQVAAAASSTSTPGSSVAATQASSSADDPYEYVYPNSVDGKYFQAAQARMYIGKHFVDELVLCQWMLAENKIPIYGYRSRTFDAVGTGRSLVQGQLAINFVSEGYMYVLLQEFKSKIASTLSTGSNTGLPSTTQSAIDQLITQRSSLLASKSSTTSVDTQLAQLGATSAGAASYIASAVAAAAGGKSARNPKTSHQNPVTLGIPFDIQVQFEGGGRTITRTLKHCLLGAADLPFSHDGKTLIETYSFIAREVN